MSRYPLKKKHKRDNINKIYRYIENTSKMTFIEKKDISCKNNIGIIRNLEIKFHDDNCYNYKNSYVYYSYIYHL
jgi:hypothetical protein